MNLMPGQWHFGQGAMLRTLLGSCVAITLWHPAKKWGGMCHFLLPSRSNRGGAALDGRYGDEAIEMLVQSIKRTGTKPGDYLAHLYGGADTMPDGMNVKFNVGQRNIEQGWALIDQHGFQLQDVDVGDNVPRTVSLDLPSGKVEVKRGKANK
ncbi:chemotaxis protein [Paucibacter sp. KBW04]|nr:chemotaxis protein [Paucibacter sp. KBW04]